MRLPTSLERFLVEWSNSLDEPPLPPLVNLEGWLQDVGTLMYILERAEDNWELKDLIALWSQVKKDFQIG